MRTTVTIDDDLAEKLEQRARERGVPFKQILNEAIRSGLAGGEVAARPYRMHPRNLGVRSGSDLRKALRLANALEDAEIGRKFEQGR